MKRFLFFVLLSLLGTLATLTAQPVYEDYTFVTLAGPGSAGPNWFDGVGNEARFSAPVGVVRDSGGNMYVADSANNTIRRVAPDGSVTTVAGLAGVAGTADGAGAVARFNTPYGIALDSLGNLYVADRVNETIRKITPTGVVSTFAGLVGTAGAADGTGSNARFRFPEGVAVDSANNVFVADNGNHTIRKITPDGVVTTFAGSAGVPGSADKTGAAARFSSPIGLAFDANGNLYVADTGNNTIRKITPGSAVTTLAGSAGSAGSNDGTNSTARFSSPFGLIVNGNNIYVADAFNHTIRNVTLDGVVTTLAGGAGVAGSTDATSLAARFNFPVGIAFDANTNLFVTDFGNDAIRQIAPDLAVTTFAGMPGGSGSADGNGSAARFNFPAAVTTDSDDNVYVADQSNDTIRKIAPDGTVTTIAGTAKAAGTNDGAGLNARFNSPAGLAFDHSGNLIVSDTVNDTIRQITPLGEVSTLAGLPLTSGTNNGAGSNARFNIPFGVAVDASGMIYVGDTHNHTIRKMTPDGTVTTFAGTAGVAGNVDANGLAAQFSFPEQLSFDNNQNLFVVDDGTSTIRKVTPSGDVTTFAGNSGTEGSADGTGTNATFNFPFGLAADASGNLFVADTDNQTIRKITPAGVVTTIAGMPGVSGSVDGSGNDARFSQPEGMAVDNQGNVYVVDALNHSIRKGYPALPDVPTVDVAAARTGVTRHFSILNQTTTTWSWKLIRHPAGSSAPLSGANTANPTITPDVEDIYVVRFQGLNNSGRTVIKTITLYADNTPPSLAITNPVSGQVSSNGVFTVRGTATDNLGLSNIWVQINGGPWIKATGTTNWSADVTPANGTNIVQAYAEDLAGNVSTTNSVDFRYGAPLTVILHGGGTVTPNLNGQLLEIGQTYTMTAQAGAGCSFINWTGSENTNSATLTFVMQVGLSFTANFTDPISPTITITSPSKGFHVSNSVFTATGTASDNGQVAAVWYQLNDGAWTMATSTTNWTAGLTLTQSANTLQAYAVDSLDNVSDTNSVAFTWVPSSQMRVIAVGQGTFSPNFDGSFLENGKTFKMTAKAGFNNIFTGWTDGAGNTISTSPTLSFLVQSNATFHANFIANPFPSLVGPFAGLFYDTNNIGATNSGYFTLSLTGFGHFSAKVQMASGQKLSFGGSFAGDGSYSNSVSVKGSAPLIVLLQLGSANAGEISGFIGNGDWVSPLFAVRALYSPANPAPQHTNKYTLVIPGGNDSTTQPGGNGYGTVSVDVSGDVIFKGVLGDGAKASQKTFINKPGVWPLFIAAHKGFGAIFGWMTFANLNDSDLSGVLYWVKQPQGSGIYPGGFNFPEGIRAVGSVYSFTNGLPLLNLAAGGVSVLQLGNPVQNSTNHFTLGNDNKITSADGLKVTITTSSGLFKGTAISPGDGSSVPVTGVLLQKQNAAYGFFLKNGQSGGVSLGQ
jgi:sugar lactone lactonase YvrE